MRNSRSRLDSREDRSAFRGAHARLHSIHMIKNGECTPMLPATLTQLIDYSNQHTVGVGMFNIVNLEFAQAIFDAAQATRLPVMLGMPERFLQYYDGEAMTEVCKTLISRSAVPISIHLDHGKTFDGAMKALKWGFSSIMFDGSSLPYEENVAKTREIVEVAHAMGASVEGELGYVGRAGVDANDSSGFTDPAQAEDFWRRTGVDALAIAIGNQHGQYNGIPKLDFPRLAAIKARVECGLVLHGGSGISDDDFVKAIQAGINKVNIYTAMDVAVRGFNRDHFQEYAAYLDYTKALTKVVQDVVEQHIRLFARAAR